MNSLNILPQEDFFDFLGDLNLAVINIKENIENRNLQEKIYPNIYKIQDEVLLNKVRL